jgi:hypothetical protein
MTRAMTYYHLASATMSPSSPTAEAYAQARRSWLCEGCALPRPGTGAIDVHLDADPEDVPLSFVSGIGVGIVRRDLLEALGHEAVAGGLWLGEVFGPDGVRAPKYASFRGKRMVIIRGKAGSSHRLCGSCGRHLYFPLGKRHLVGPVAAPFDIAESQFNQLVVSERVHAGVSGKRWRKLTIDRLPVVDGASDGQDLPMLVDN